MPKVEWKLGEFGADIVVKANVAFYDKIRTILTRRCKAPDCGYVISALEDSFAVPGVGSVCGACYHMYEALSSPSLKNPYYFRMLHEQWVREKSDPKRWDRLGL